MPKKNDELAKLRQVEINKLYSQVRQLHPQALKEDVCKMMNEFPAPRFYVQWTTAYEWIWKIEHIGNKRREYVHKQASDFYKLFREAWFANPEKSDVELVKETILHEAPSFYIIPRDLKKW